MNFINEFFTMSIVFDMWCSQVAIYQECLGTSCQC